MSVIKNLLLFLIIPITGWAVASWFTATIDADLMGEYGITSAQLCEGASEEILQLCNEQFYEVNLLRSGSTYTAIAAAFVILSFTIASTFCGTNRAKISRIFPLLIPLILISLSGIVVVQGAVITYALYLAQVMAAGAWYPFVTLGIGLAAAVAALTIIKALFTSLRARPHTIFNGIVVDEQTSRELHVFVSEIAESVQGRRPDNIVVGLEPTFYAVSAPVKILSADLTLNGETLYLSLPLMRLFNSDELRSVIGHELGHFSGEDTEYSKRFAPIFGSLQRSYVGLAESSGPVAIPVIVTLGNLLESFDKNVKKISRERELLADKAGALAGDEQSLVKALLKVSLYSEAWGRVTNRIVQRMLAGAGFSKNMSWLFASVVQHNVDADSISDRMLAISEEKISHPTDTHPTTAERAEQLSVRISDIGNHDLMLPAESVISRFPQHKDFEEKLSTFEQAIYQARGADGEMQDEQILQRVISMFAAFMTLADGDIDNSEVEMAESIGAACFENFDFFQYREYCHYPELLLEEDQLLEAASGLSSDMKRLIVDMCRDIAMADGALAEDETALLGRIMVKLGVETEKLDDDA